MTTGNAPAEPENKEARAIALIEQGIAHKALGELDAAEKCHMEALQIAPELPRVHLNLGNVRLAKGFTLAAIDCYHHALALKPDYVFALFNLGNAHQQALQYLAAIAAYRKVLTLQPDFADAEVAMGNACDKLDRKQEAIDCYRRALALRPDFAPVYGNLGLVHQRAGNWEAALEAFRRAAQLNPDDGYSASQAYECANQLVDWSQRADDEADLISRVQAGKGDMSLAAMLTLEPERSDVASFQKAAASATTAHYLSADLALKPFNFSKRTKGRLLRIGYIASDLREPAIAGLLNSIVNAHDRSRIAVSLYSYGTVFYPEGAALGAPYEILRDLSGLSDADAAATIVDDAIDILVNLDNSTTKARMAIFALRPAPILVNWLGYPGTYGQPVVFDYLFGDAIVSPIGRTSDFSESLALLPLGRRPVVPHLPPRSNLSRTQAGLPETGFVFCCFHSYGKFTPQCFDLWCQLLRETPRSVLWLLAGPKRAMDNIRREANIRGVSEERVIFTPQQSQKDKLSQLQLTDLLLDTYPYSAETYCGEALWLGVPLLTRSGGTFASRLGASLLHAVGISELVTYTPEQFVSTALSLTQEPKKLAAIKETILANRTRVEIFDVARFTNSLEHLYQRMWNAHAQFPRPLISLTGTALGE